MVWIDGGLVPTERAVVSVFDHGLTVGDGVFETLKVVEGRPFALTRHLARLARSAAGLGLTLPFGDDELRAAVDDAVRANGLRRGRVRITVTGGVAPLGSDRGTPRPTVIVAVAELAPWPQTAAVVTVPWPRNERGAVAGLKTTSYAENVVALAFAHERGADEAIFANTTGALCEGTGANVFLVRDGVLTTPPLSAGCLAGVTRELLCELLEVDERDLPLAALATADEAFLTSSTRDVQPIASVDGQVLPLAPGPVTERAMAVLGELEAQDLDP